MGCVFSKCAREQEDYPETYDVSTASECTEDRDASHVSLAQNENSRFKSEGPVLGSVHPHPVQPNGSVCLSIFTSLLHNEKKMLARGGDCDDQY